MTRPDTTESGGPREIDCETTIRRLWDYIDGRLPGLSQEEVEAHLAWCEGCRSRFGFARTLQRALAASAAPPCDADDEARLRERVRSALARLAAEPDEREPA
jgi:anti-sigma factor RsiW